MGKRIALRKVSRVGRRLAYSIRCKKRSDRDADVITDSLRCRWLTEIKEHWLEQGRLQGLNELRGDNLTVRNGEDASFDLVPKII